MARSPKSSGPDNRIDSYRIFMRFSTFLRYLAQAFEDHWAGTYLSKRGDVLHEDIGLPNFKVNWIRTLKMDAQKFILLAETCLRAPRTGCSTGIHNRELQHYLAPNISTKRCLVGGGLGQIEPYVFDERVQDMMLRKWFIEYNGYLPGVNRKQKQACGQTRHGYFPADERQKYCRLLKVMGSWRAKKPMFQFVLAKASGTSELPSIHASFDVYALQFPVEREDLKSVVRAAVRAFNDLWQCRARR